MSFQDHRGDTTMPLRSTGSVLVALLWTTTVVLCRAGFSVTYTAQSICVLKGSTAEMSCSYQYPRGYTIKATQWYYRSWSYVKIPDDPTGRVSYRENKDKDCTLRITDLREEDSTSYYFSFKNGYSSWTSGSSVYLTITGLQVKVQFDNENRWKTLTCSTTCPLTGNPTYIWYKNGQQIDESSSPQYRDSVYTDYRDSYSCSVKGHEDLHSPSACFLDQYCSRVTYTKRRMCVLKGSSVDISCTYTGYYTVTSSLWFSPKQTGSWRDELIPENINTDPGYVGRVEYPDQESRRYKGPFTLRITDLREEDSAEYRFTFKTYNFEWGHNLPGTTLTVTDIQVKMTPATVTEGQSVTLTCSTSCPLTENPIYTWYINEQPKLVTGDTSSLYQTYFSDGDSYSCGVKGLENLRSPAVCKKCWSVTYTSQSICAFKGSTVDIPCSYTYPRYHEVKEAFWFTKQKPGKEPEDVSLVPGNDGHTEYRGAKKNVCTLRITDLRSTDSSEYRFRFITSGGKYSGTSVVLTVTDVVLEMNPTSLSEEETVTLTCRTTCSLDPYPEYIWYKNGQPIENTNSTLHILSVSREDAGRYSCGVKGHKTHSPEETLTVTYGPKNTSVSVSPSGEIVEGSSVTLTCSSDANPPVYKYTWYKDNRTLLNASGETYSITNITSEDSGEYYCEAENVYGRLNSSSVSVEVQYGPKNTSVSVSPSGEIVEGSSVTLTCSSDANPPVYKYTWYKKTVTSPKASGQSYSITNVTSEDSGEYYCEAENGIGTKNWTAVTIIVAGKRTSVVSISVGITVAVMWVWFCSYGFMGRKSFRSTADPRDLADHRQEDTSPVYENVSDKVTTSTAAKTADTDNQDVLHYASVHYSASRDQEVPLYSTVQLPQPQKQEEEVQYAAVLFKCPSAATRPTAQTVEVDPSIIYCTSNKPRKKRT